MDPINQKEITSSFIQFMVLFLITVVFAIVCVFFDQKFSQDSYKALKAEYKELKKNSQNDFVPEIIQYMDSTQKRINALNVGDKMDYDIRKENIFREMLRPDPKDSSAQGKMNYKVSGIFSDWISDKTRLTQIPELQNTIIKKEKTINQLQDFMKQNCSVKQETIDMMTKN